MIYQNPHLLYALSAIAIPIIIHLFNLRKHQTIYFSSTRFLKEIKNKNRKKSQLKNILILLCRILAITFLVIAFARPYIPAKNTNTKKHIFLYVDNSQSMDIDFGKGNLLNKAKNKALEIIEAYPLNQHFYIVTNDFLSAHSSSYKNESIKIEIEKINSTPKIRNINTIISRVNSIQANNTHIYFISDFQENTLEIANLKSPTKNNHVSLIPIENNQTTNISLDTLFFVKPIFKENSETELTTMITNTGDKDIKDEVIFLYLNDKQKSQKNISLRAGEQKSVKFKFLTNEDTLITGVIKTYDTPTTFDNNLFFTLSQAEKINITTINENHQNNAFKALFGEDPDLFNLTSLKKETINHNNLSQQDVIILNEIQELSSGLLNTLISFTNNGGTLIITPPVQLQNFNSYNILLEALKINTIKNKIKNKIKINKFNTKNPIYQNVFSKEPEKINYPASNIAYYLNNTKSSNQIIGFANKKNFLSEYRFGKGKIYQFSSPLSDQYNNFTKHALFVPTLINIANSSILASNPYYIIGSNKYISTKHTSKSTDIIHIKGKETDIIPIIKNKNGKQLLDTYNQISKNGIYSITTNNQVVEKIAFNYKNSEGATKSLNNTQLLNYISNNNIQNTSIIKSINGNLKQKIQEKEIGKEYWKIFIILSLVFFAFEILLIKLIKT